MDERTRKRKRNWGEEEKEKRGRSIPRAPSLPYQSQMTPAALLPRLDVAGKEDGVKLLNPLTGGVSGGRARQHDQVISKQSYRGAARKLLSYSMQQRYLLTPGGQRLNSAAKLDVEWENIFFIIIYPRLRALLSYRSCLRGLRCLQRPAFREQRIDGSALPLLTEEHLTSSINMKLGPALKLRSVLARRLGACNVCLHCDHCHSQTQERRPSSASSSVYQERTLDKFRGLVRDDTLTRWFGFTGLVKAYNDLRDLQYSHPEDLLGSPTKCCVDIETDSELGRLSLAGHPAARRLQRQGGPTQVCTPELSFGRRVGRPAGQSLWGSQAGSDLAHPKPRPCMSILPRPSVSQPRPVPSSRPLQASIILCLTGAAEKEILPNQLRHCPEALLIVSRSAASGHILLCDSRSFIIRIEPVILSARCLNIDIVVVYYSMCNSPTALASSARLAAATHYPVFTTHLTVTVASNLVNEFVVFVTRSPLPHFLSWKR
ncbi:Sterile alpha motif domain-containing protein 11 [Portunus trituberculatus]|uniref:Sterile alpha motif domain-containing protein 11 n=1 Tax=Portunus trituberculatus TaxID=210409 RepID=A0A5B7CF95_PORTR|nr:Sterile alpha motif domain-containing protein 11 [Portunus trituberculatus]